ARDEIAVLVLDRVDRAIDAADRAVDAALRVDVVLAFGLAPNGIGGALDLADAAADAFIGDEVGHGFSVYLNDCCVLVDVDRRDAARALAQSELRRQTFAYPDDRTAREFTSRRRCRPPARVQRLLGGEGRRRPQCDCLEIEIAAGDDRPGSAAD